MQRQCNAVVYRVNVAGPPTKIEERLVLGRGLDYPPVAEQGTAPPLSPARLIRARSGRNGTRVNLSNLRNWSETSRVEEPGTFDAVRHEPCDSDQFVVAMGWPSGELAQAHCLGFFAPANRNGGELFSDNSLPSEPSAETGPSGSAEEDEYRMSEELKKRFNARRLKVPLDAFPKIVAADAACLKLAAFDKARPENQPDAE